MNTFVPINRYRSGAPSVPPLPATTESVPARKSREIKGKHLLVGGDDRINDAMNNALFEGKLTVFGLTLRKGR